LASYAGWFYTDITYGQLRSVKDIVWDQANNQADSTKIHTHTCSKRFTPLFIVFLLPYLKSSQVLPVHRVGCWLVGILFPVRLPTCYWLGLVGVPYSKLFSVEPLYLHHIMVASENGVSSIPVQMCVYVGACTCTCLCVYYH
jgi:hypothetical protein